MRPNDWMEKGENEEVEFDLHCKMKKAWANEFLSMCTSMEAAGQIGESRYITLYADGDGDFHPEFHINFEWEVREPIPTDNKIRVDRLFDAG